MGLDGSKKSSLLLLLFTGCSRTIIYLLKNRLCNESLVYLVEIPWRTASTWSELFISFERVISKQP